MHYILKAWINLALTRRRLFTSTVQVQKNTVLSWRRAWCTLSIASERKAQFYTLVSGNLPPPPPPPPAQLLYRKKISLHPKLLCWDPPPSPTTTTNTNGPWSNHHNRKTASMNMKLCSMTVTMPDLLRKSSCKNFPRVKTPSGSAK